MSESSEGPSKAPQKQQQENRFYMGRRTFLKLFPTAVGLGFGLAACGPGEQVPPRKGTIQSTATPVSGAPNAPGLELPLSPTPDKEQPKPTEVLPAWKDGWSFENVVYNTEFGQIGPETHAFFSADDGTEFNLITHPRNIDAIREEIDLIVAEKPLTKDSPLTAETVKLIEQGYVTLDDLKHDEFYFKRPDNGTYQNYDPVSGKVVPIQTLHSANFRGAPLSAEPLRSWLESNGNPIIEQQVTAEEMQKRAESLVGKEVRITQGDTSAKGEIAAIIRVDADQFEEKLNAPKPDGSTEYDYLNAVGMRHVWDQEGDFVIYMFCGRTADKEEPNGRDHLETHRWLVVFRSTT